MKKVQFRKRMDAYCTFTLATLSALAWSRWWRGDECGYIITAAYCMVVAPTVVLYIPIWKLEKLVLMTPESGVRTSKQGEREHEPDEPRPERENFIHPPTKERKNERTWSKRKR